MAHKFNRRWFLRQAGLGLAAAPVLRAARRPNIVLIGYIARLVETAGRSVTAHLSPGLLQIDRAWRCNAVEDNQQEIATVRLLLRPTR